MKLRVLDPALYDEELNRSGGFGPRYPGDAAVDLRARVDTTVHAGETAQIPLGVTTQFPKNMVGWITARSYVELHMNLHVGAGIIDSGYAGEVHCFATAKGSPVEVQRGDRICQLLIVHIESPGLWTHEVVDETEELNRDWTPTARGAKGLGSSGRA